MAFTNPILAGEALNSTGIKSDNYVQGVSGWRIATNGAAEFQNVVQRGNLSVPSITLNGRDLQAQLDEKAKGLAAFIRGYPVVSVNAAGPQEGQVLYTEWQVEPGRQYEMLLTNISNDVVGTNNCEYLLRYTEGQGSFPFPDNSSGIVATSGRFSQFQNVTIRAYTEAPPNGHNILRLRVSLYCYSGTARSYAPGGGAMLAVYDVGTVKPPVGIVGTGTPTKVLKEWTITANDTRAYHQNGTNLGGTFGRDMVQATALSGTDHCRSYATFSTADLALIADLQGVPFSDMVVCEWWVNWYFWYQGAGWALIGHHNETGLSSSAEPGTGIPNTQQFYIAGQVGNWLGMLSGNQTFVNALRAGTAKGLMLGASSGNDRQYGGIADGAFATSPPKLHVKYWK